MQDITDIETGNARQNTVSEQSIYTQELIKVLRTVNEDKAISYEALQKIIGIDIRPNHAGYSYQYSARKILERDENIAFEVIAKKGLKRLTPEKIAAGSGAMYLRKKKSLIKRSKRRINTINDDYDNLSEKSKVMVTIHRTILAFDNEIIKRKNIIKIENKVQELKKLIGFNETISLFENNH